MAYRRPALFAGIFVRQSPCSTPGQRHLELCLCGPSEPGAVELVADGYDPALGIMHADRDDASAFVLDMMEPERPKMDRAVLAFLKSAKLHPADFAIREDGVVRLNPELARKLATLAK